jgi:Ni/Co efflux regulator RcnB
MRLFNHLFLRIFVALLVTMLIANTVYAGGMMVSTALTNAQQKQNVQQKSNVQQKQSALHNHEAQHAHQHAHAELNTHEIDHQTTSDGGCKHCNHCLACSSMMPNHAMKVIEDSHKAVMVTSSSPVYLSPTSPQLQKPPIA